MIVKHRPGVFLVPPSKRQPEMQGCFLSCCSWLSGNSRSPVSYNIPCQTSTDVDRSPGFVKANTPWLEAARSSK